MFAFRALTILIVAGLTGCAGPRQLSRAEQLATNSHIYEGVTKDQIANATERLFRLADGDDFQITHSPNGVAATRMWLAYVVVAAVTGVDTWLVQIEPEGQGWKVFMQVGTQASSSTVMPTSNGGFSAGQTPTIASGVPGTAIYDLFWSRLDYLLGKRAAWMTCKEANERVSQGIVFGPNDALCNSFNMKDDSPTH